MSTIKVTNIQATGETASRAVSGVAAAWVHADSTTSIYDSFNISTGTDNGTGDYSYSLSSAFTGANDYSQGSCVSGTAWQRQSQRNAARYTASVIAINTGRTDTNVVSDQTHNITAHGDLA